ncbi:aldehyde dehydrogenase family protein, partial [Halorubrum ezzemoulense]|uniref:aldehyde dehydrogenase family protein n=1 Tax=Halorubrum ezzemoulense TaxID=337243 RepID=UPI0023303742
MDVVNPATGARGETYDDHEEDDGEAALDRSEQAFKDWQTRPLREREQLLANAAEVRRENKQVYAETMTREMGKPISQAVGEVEKCAWVCEHYAEHASAYLEADHHQSPPGSEVKTEHEP